MLKDRRELVMHELKKTHDAASAMYMDIIRNGGDPHSVEYQTLRERVTDLQFDLKMINELIDRGHE